MLTSDERPEMVTDLKPRTRHLLLDLRSRRESGLSWPPRKHPKTGFWVFTRRRVRALADYQRLTDFRRAPESVREHASRWIERARAEARHFEAGYGSEQERP